MQPFNDENNYKGESALKKAGDMYFGWMSSKNGEKLMTNNMPAPMHTSRRRSDSFDSNEYRKISKAIDKSLPASQTRLNINDDAVNASKKWQSPTLLNFRKANNNFYWNQSQQPSYCSNSTLNNENGGDQPEPLCDDYVTNKEILEKAEKLVKTNEILAKNTRELKSTILANFRRTMELLEVHEEQLERQSREMRRLQLALIAQRFQNS